MKHNNEVKTIVFPVAGIGSRFLPATKSVAKELLPVLNRPLIEYAVEEAINSGIEKFIFITSPSKQNITGHFKINTELQELIRDISQRVYTHLGPGHNESIYQKALFYELSNYNLR